MNFQYLPSEIFMLLLLSIRVLVILSFTPVISMAQTPFFVRVVLAVLTAFISQNLITTTIQIPQDFYTMLSMLIGEALIGAVIGVFIQIAFLLLGMFSEFFSTQMGLRAAQIINPLSQVESAIIGQFAGIIVLLVFITSFSLQKIFYYGIAQSFVILKSQDLFLASRGSGGDFLSFIFVQFARLFEQSFVIALPLFSVLFIVNIGMALYGKVAPQMNLLVVGIPLQIGLGFFVFFLFLPNIVHAAEIFLDRMIEFINIFFREAQRL